MTVHELIDELQKINDKDLPIMTYSLNHEFQEVDRVEPYALTPIHAKDGRFLKWDIWIQEVNDEHGQYLCYYIGCL